MEVKESSQNYCRFLQQIPNEASEAKLRWNYATPGTKGLHKSTGGVTVVKKSLERI